MASNVVPALLGQVAGFASSRQLNICGGRRFADLAASSLISHAAHLPICRTKRKAGTAAEGGRLAPVNETALHRPDLALTTSSHD